MKCYNCGNEIDEQDRFCEYCGANQQERPEEFHDEEEVSVKKQKRKKRKSGIHPVAIALITAGCVSAAGIGGLKYVSVTNRKEAGMGSENGLQTETTSAKVIDIQSETAPQSETPRQSETAYQDDIVIEDETKETAVPATESETSQPETSFFDDGIDAVNNSFVGIEGTIESSTGAYYLNFTERQNIYCKDQEGSIVKLQGLSRLQINPVSQEFLPEDHVGDRLVIWGAIYVVNNMPVIDLYEADIIEAAETEPATTEEEIHRYEVFREDVTWLQAYRKCLQKGGYLVRFNTLEEFQYVTEMIDARNIEKIQLFVGARRNPDERAYFLIDENNERMGTQLNGGGTPWMDAFWLYDSSDSSNVISEPSFRDDALNLEECYVSIFRYGSDNRWVFNDVPNDLIDALETNKGKVGYICEYED